jgi:hypothetical protein
VAGCNRWISQSITFDEMAALSLFFNSFHLSQQFSKAGSRVRSGAVITSFKTSSDADKCGKPYIRKTPSCSKFATSRKSLVQLSYFLVFSF